MTEDEKLDRELIAQAATEATIMAHAGRAQWNALNSAHEGYGVMLEEVDELWDEIKIKQKNRDLDKLRKEALDVAAMALRIAAEVADERRGRR